MAPNAAYLAAICNCTRTNDLHSNTPAAFDAIAATLPLGSVGYEPSLSASGQRLIWIEAAVADRLKAMGEPGESYSDVIVRLVELEAQGLRR